MAFPNNGRAVRMNGDPEPGDIDHHEGPAVLAAMADRPAWRGTDWFAQDIVARIAISAIMATAPRI